MSNAACVLCVFLVWPVSSSGRAGPGEQGTSLWWEVGGSSLAQAIGFSVHEFNSVVGDIQCPPDTSTRPHVFVWFAAANRRSQQMLVSRAAD